MNKVFLTVLCCLALVGVGCGGGSSSSGTEAGNSTAANATSSSSTADSGSSSANASAESTDRKPKVEVPSGPPPKKVQTREIVEGDGAEAKSGDEVKFDYVCVDYKTGKEIGSSWGQEPYVVTLGEGQMIPGWEQGIEGMKVGGRREAIVPPAYAWGNQGFGKVPPNATLVFVIDLLSVK